MLSLPMKTSCFTWLFLFFGLFSSFNTLAQKETDHWYFGGRAGLRFQNTNPTIQLDGRIKAREGCDSISDSLGNLLFYTAGDTVYNKYHQKMNNGWLLHGHQSSAQSSVIVQNPYSLNLYYL